jgi:hypothetical protein
MLWFGGIHDDKKLGIEPLGKTIDGGRYLRPFVKNLLAWAARKERQDTSAQRFLPVDASSSEALILPIR